MNYPRSHSMFLARTWATALAFILLACSSVASWAQLFEPSSGQAKPHTQSLLPQAATADEPAAADEPAVEQTMSPASEGEPLEDALFTDASESERCISLRRLDRTEVLSNQSIVFHMRGDKTFINNLRFRCPGLSARDAVMFDSRGSQLCNLDQVTVLDSLGGRFVRGARCGLGHFFPIDDEQLSLIKGQREEREKQARGRGQVE